MADDQTQNQIAEEVETEEPKAQEDTDQDQSADQTPVKEGESAAGEPESQSGAQERDQDETAEEAGGDFPQQAANQADEESPAKWYVIHTYSGHENRVAATLKQRVESEHLEDKILEVLVPTQEKIEIRGGKKETVKEKIFPGYILVKMILDDTSWLAVRTTQGVTSFIGMGNKPTAIPDHEVASIVNFMKLGGQPTYKQIFSEGDTVKIIDGPFSEFIGKVDTVDKERGKVKVLVSIFGRETPVELDFLQVAKL